MDDPALEVHGLRKRFGKGRGSVLALDDVTFSVRRGEVFAFLGPNGSGKTTTMNVVADVLRPDAGEVRLLGRRPGDRAYFDRASFMTGDSQYLWSFTGRQILDFYSRFLKVPRDRVDSLSRKWGMDVRLDRPWTSYSNGEKTKLRLLRALMKDPEILFLDEPSVGLDPDAASYLREALSGLNRAGTTVFLTSHYMKDVEALAHRVCFLWKGRVERVGPLSDYVGAEPLVDVEFEGAAPPSLRHAARDGGHVVTVALHDLAHVLAAGAVRSVRSVERNVEDYFLDLARRGGGPSPGPGGARPEIGRPGTGETA